MVCYCCVKGCSNNSNNKKKDPSVAVSFHTFPSNPELKLKWLRAIGRPTWTPPTHARICSAHFRGNQISLDGVRVRLTDHAVPVNALPLNSNFEATHVEVCRICLVDDVKMYSIHTGLLKICMESVVGFNENCNMEGLPEFVCYICAALLMKCYKLVEKSLVAQVTLLDIFTQNGEITKCLIKKQNRKSLTTELKSYNVTPSTVFKYKSDEIINKICNEDEEIWSNEEALKLENNIEEFDSEEFDSLIDHSKTEKENHSINDIVDVKMDNDDDITIDEEMIDYADVKDDIGDSLVLEQIDDENKSRLETKKVGKRSKVFEIAEKGDKVKRKRCNIGVISDEVNLQEHFKIEKLTLEKQIEEWKKSVTRHDNRNYVHECDICGKMFVNQSSLRNHGNGHDPRRGAAECSVCKLRFKSNALASSHAKYAHSTKFQCKMCSKELCSVGMAKKHYNHHVGHKYRCPHCPFTTAHASARGAHVRAKHACCACLQCGRACASLQGLKVHESTAHGGSVEIEKGCKFKCEQCDMSFATEAALRVHALTANRHRNKPDLCDPTPVDRAASTTCRTCGEQFHSRPELLSHRKALHPHRRRAKIWSLPGDCYPTQCEHCDVVVNNRQEHWRHVRRHHPSRKGTYRPVVNVICATCGKGFQNQGKLRLHELRHRSPSVRCTFCPKLFYDKYLLATHLSTHSEARPHRCRTCGRGFKGRSNMERHMKSVHSDVATYECNLCGKKFKYTTSLNSHVRYVHYKMPQPPRKRPPRARNTRANEHC